MRGLLRIGLLAAIGGCAAYEVRGRINRWGASDEEVERALPGDDLVADARLRTTRAITVRAPADRVFPWLAQLGQGRGGFYSYDWLENLIGLDMRSADHILPELQELKIGDPIAMAPGPPFYGFLVADAAPPARLVLEMRIHPFTGLQQEAGVEGPSLRASWAFVLEPIDQATTRLIARNRASFRLPMGARLPYQLALETIEFVMERRMLIGIRERAERMATSAIPPATRSRRAGLRTATDARRDGRRAPARQPTDRATPAARERLSLPLSGARRSASSPTCHRSET